MATSEAAAEPDGSGGIRGLALIALSTVPQDSIRSVRIFYAQAGG